MKLALPLALAAALAAHASATSDVARNRWPGFRGGGDSHVPHQELPKQWSLEENLAWQLELPGYGQSSPVVWDGHVFTTSILGENKETLVVSNHALDSGELVWEERLPAGRSREYSKTYARASATPVVDHEAFYAFFESGDVLSLSHDGNLRWRRNIFDTYGEFEGNHGIGSSLAQTRELVFVLVQHGGPSYLLAVEKSSGETRFKVDRPVKTAWTTPVVSNKNGRDEVLVSANGTVEAMDAASGERLWLVDGVAKNLIASPSATDDVVVVGASEKSGCIAINRDGSGEILWTADASADFASPLITDACVYFINQAGGLTCVDPSTGRALWRHRLPGPAWASPALIGDDVYVFTKAGASVVFSDSADGFAEVATGTIPVPEDDDALYGVAIADSSIVMRTSNRLFCVRQSGD